MRSVQKVGVVGAGLIGSGWASRCSARNLEVLVYDPAPNGEEVLRSHIDNAWFALNKLGFNRDESGEIRFSDDLEEVAANLRFHPGKCTGKH